MSLNATVGWASKDNKGCPGNRLKVNRDRHGWFRIPEGHKIDLTGKSDEDEEDEEYVENRYIADWDWTGTVSTACTVHKGVHHYSYNLNCTFSSSPP